jgi:hypothetical protein
MLAHKCSVCGTFFFPAQNQLQGLTGSTRGPPWVSSVALCLGSASLAGGAAELPLRFEDNGVRFGLDYTRQGYFT